jgi:hypothetical protein
LWCFSMRSIVFLHTCCCSFSCLMLLK